MKRIGYTSLATLALTAGLASFAFATPAPNSAVISTRLFNDCPTSILSSTNLYPALVSITDVMNPACVGFANRHAFSFSEDGGVTPSLFVNGSHFKFGADVTISGGGFGEGGLRLSPWWSQLIDGVFMLNTGTGEVACFAGRLPFYSFTVANGVTYVQGTTVHMQIEYLANGLSLASPATIQYTYTDGSGTYSSGPIAFDQGNPAKDPPHGQWGNLNDGMAGGYFMPRASSGSDLTIKWENITFVNEDVTESRTSSWGRLKALYR
jgi:hypothetical protein